jgi:hypothetical protein
MLWIHQSLQIKFVFIVLCALKFRVRVCEGFLMIPMNFKNGKNIFD